MRGRLLTGCPDTEVQLSGTRECLTHGSTRTDPQR